MSQMSSIYSQDLLPSLFASFSARLMILNFDFQFMLNMDCFNAHFLPNFVDRSSFSFIFWQSVTMPWLLCLGFTLLHKLLCRRRQVHQRRKSQPEDARKAQAAELQWHRNTASACTGLALFVMMFVHPSIATTMFQIFNCESIFFDDAELKVQYWLKQDSHMECYTTSWYIAAMFAGFTLVTYVFGYPLVLYLTMRQLRSFRRVKMEREVAERHIDLVLAGQWLPCTINDVALVRNFQSLHPDLSLCNNQALRMSVSADKEAQGKQAQAIELFIRRDTFVQVAGLDEDSLIAGRKNLERKKLERMLQPPGSMRHRHGSGTNRSSSVGQELKPYCSSSSTPKKPNDPTSIDQEMPHIILLADGRVIEKALCFQRPDVGDRGAITQVPVTRLDDFDVDKVLAQFKEPFEDDFYFWQCYEIVRRTMQTGVVVLVYTAAGRTVSLTYALIFSMLAILLHQSYSPYVNDALDILQMTILVNQFLIQTTVIIVYMDSSSSLLATILFTLQIMLICFALTLIVPAFRPAFKQLSIKAHQLISPFYEKQGETTCQNDTEDEFNQDSVQPDDSSVWYPVQPDDSRTSVWLENPMVDIIAAQEQSRIGMMNSNPLFAVPNGSEEHNGRKEEISTDDVVIFRRIP
ncbi:hypothetical protein CYMTET_56877 [Cymbomonas tetramitiformis]|uniref:Uncharacterized protein n=1 Tax=Cymbomonas tetramitiformis TaxID=36881 RepID=A0AAE0EM50_9CHLO|nr:hypothetical protein CYMTET_56877 [Cymbomonas tetramitiformis]